MIDHLQKKQPTGGFLKPNIGDQGNHSLPGKLVGKPKMVSQIQAGMA